MGRPKRTHHPADRSGEPPCHASSCGQALGEPGVAELVGLLGYYTLVAMTLKALDLDLPEGATSDLA